MINLLKFANFLVFWVSIFFKVGKCNMNYIYIFCMIYTFLFIVIYKQKFIFYNFSHYLHSIVTFYCFFTLQLYGSFIVTYLLLSSWGPNLFWFNWTFSTFSSRTYDWDLVLSELILHTSVILSTCF